MIRSLIVGSIITCIPLLAEAPEKAFYVDLHRISPSFDGHFEGKQDGETIYLDTKDDLDLVKNSTKIGVDLEYQGPRFGVEFSTDAQDYKGSHYLQRQITVKGNNYPAGALVRSDVKIRNYTLNWTIRALKSEQAWLGVDLGARGWDLDLHITDDQPLLGNTESSVKISVPIPQVGLSAGFQALEGQIVTRGYFHVMSYRGASYQRLGADVRYFPINWLGLRVFADSESLRVPKGSIQDDLELKLNRSGFGFGVIARF